MHGIPGDVSSPSRFVRVAYTNTHYPQQNNEAANVSRLFHTLVSVQMVDGMSKMGNGQFSARCSPVAIPGNQHVLHEHV